MTVVHKDHSGAHGHDDGHHQPFLAHHFDTMKQQFDSGKLGIWLFLVTEVLFFSGLFCAYAVYRAHHPDVFIYAHHFLDTRLGATNTVVLIVSSLTIAWAIRCVQLGKRRAAVVLLGITLACAATFMCIKYVEYTHKIHDGLLWGHHFNPPAAHEVVKGVANTAAGAVEHVITRPPNAHIFFGLYFAMTGLHGIHVLIGMGIIVWIMIRTARGDFGPDYYGPVEFTGLYWHLVDLIWIYLFPLLYLIG